MSKREDLWVEVYKQNCYGGEAMANEAVAAFDRAFTGGGGEQEGEGVLFDNGSYVRYDNASLLIGDEEGREVEICDKDTIRGLKEILCGQ